MSLKATALRSGSSGNLFLFEKDQTRVVIDCGVNGKTFASALMQAEVPEEETSQIQGILITHEHSDHISGLGVVMRRYKLPVYMTRKTMEAVLPSLGKVDLNLIHLVHPGESFALGDLEVKAFRIPHDAADPVGYSITDGKKKVSLCTDLGEASPAIRAELEGSQLVFLESNYEPDLLAAGPYPYYLKERIRGGKGHLSNHESAELAMDLVKQGTERLVLSHLSRENNYPAMAELVVKGRLSQEGAEADRDYKLEVAQRFSNSGKHVLD